MWTMSKLSKWRLWVVVGCLLAGGAWYMCIRDTPRWRVARLLGEIAALPGGNIDIFYLGRRPSEIHADWEKLDVEAVPALLCALHDSNVTKRCWAASKIGDLGDARGVEPLVGLLADEEFVVRAHAARALGQIGDHRSIEPISDCLRDGKVSVRSEAAAALGRFRDPRAVSPLLAALDDPEAIVRANAVCSLGQLGDERSIEPIRLLLEKEDSNMVERTAKEALERLSGLKIRSK
jgi:hypothetical protein